MIKVEKLTPDEFAQPDGTRFPCHAILRGVKSAEGEVLARSSIISLPHIEGTWAKSGHRVAMMSVLGELEQDLARSGAKNAMAFAPNENPNVAAYLFRMGYKQVNVTLWMKEVKCP